MKKLSKSKVIFVIMVTLLVWFMATSVFATKPDVVITEESGSTNILNENTNSNSNVNTNTNTNTNLNTNKNVSTLTTSNVNTNNNVANTSLAKTGTNEVYLIAIIGVVLLSSVFACKKINDYKLR